MPRVTLTKQLADIKRELEGQEKVVRVLGSENLKLKSFLATAKSENNGYKQSTTDLKKENATYRESIQNLTKVKTNKERTIKEQAGLINELEGHIKDLDHQIIREAERGEALLEFVNIGLEILYPQLVNRKNSTNWGIMSSEERFVLLILGRI